MNMKEPVVLNSHRDNGNESLINFRIRKILMICSN